MKRREFEGYLEKVFDFPALVAQLPEGRQSPQHACQKVFAALFLGAACQMASLHQVERECRDGALAHRIGPISEDTFRYALQRLAPEAVFGLGCAVARQLKRNGLLRAARLGGLVVAAVDGVEICSSYVRCCEACLERTVERHVEGARRAAVQYYHRIVGVAVVSTPFPIVLGIRFQAKGEGEVSCALALLRDLVARLGRRFLDVVVADALYLQTSTVAALEALGLDWVCTVKENQPEFLAEVERLTSGAPEIDETSASEDVQVWHVPEVYWAAAARAVRVVKTLRTQTKRRLTVQRDGDQRTLRKVPVAERSTNIYASNLALVTMPPAVLAQVGRSRWRIDTEVFQTLTTQCHLKRPSVHQHHDQALVVLTMIRALAYTLVLVFYHRQVLSRCRHGPPGFGDLARRLTGEGPKGPDSS